MRKLTCATIILLAIFALGQQPEASPAAHPTAAADQIWSELMEGNKRFVSGRLKPEHVVSDRKSLMNEQHPKRVSDWIAPLHLWPESVLLSDVGLSLATRVHLRLEWHMNNLREAEYRRCKKNLKVESEALELVVCLK